MAVCVVVLSSLLSNVRPKGKARRYDERFAGHYRSSRTAHRRSAGHPDRDTHHAPRRLAGGPPRARPRSPFRCVAPTLGRRVGAAICRGLCVSTRQPVFRSGVPPHTRARLRGKQRTGDGPVLGTAHIRPSPQHYLQRCRAARVATSSRIRIARYADARIRAPIEDSWDCTNLGLHTVSLYLIVDGASATIEFLRNSSVPLPPPAPGPDRESDACGCAHRRHRRDDRRWRRRSAVRRVSRSRSRRWRDIRALVRSGGCDESDSLSKALVRDTERYGADRDLWSLGWCYAGANQVSGSPFPPTSACDPINLQTFFDLAGLALCCDLGGSP